MQSAMHARDLGPGGLGGRPGVPGLGGLGVGPGGMITGNEVKPHQCQQCLKSFSSNHQLVQHIRVHTGEKPYKCSYCDRRFKQLSHVQQHTRLHTGKPNVFNFLFSNNFKKIYYAERYSINQGGSSDRKACISIGKIKNILIDASIISAKSMQRNYDNNNNKNWSCPLEIGR